MDINELVISDEVIEKIKKGDTAYITFGDDERNNYAVDFSYRLEGRQNRGRGYYLTVTKGKLIKYDGGFHTFSQIIDFTSNNEYIENLAPCNRKSNKKQEEAMLKVNEDIIKYGIKIICMNKDKSKNNNL